jgi:hypothetical protein
VDDGAVYDYVYAGNGVDPGVVASVLVRMDNSGAVSVLQDDVFTGPELDVGGLPVAADNGEQVFSHLGGLLSAPVLDGVSHRDGNGAITRLVTAGDSRPGGVGTYDSPLVQQFRSGCVLVMDREVDGLRFDNDAVVVLDLDNAGASRTVVARGQVVDGVTVDTILAASLGEDGSVAYSVLDLSDVVRVVVDRAGVVERVAVAGSAGPGGGIWTTLIGGFAWRPDGWIFSGRLTGGALDEGVFPVRRLVGPDASDRRHRARRELRCAGEHAASVLRRDGTIVDRADAGRRCHRRSRPR